MQNKYNWRKTGEGDSLNQFPEHEEYELCYARTYTVGQGFNYSDTNNLISNLKKKTTDKKEALHYKQIAIDKFSEELIPLLRLTKTQCVIVPMPPSKTKSHPEYDNRIEIVATNAIKNLNNIRCASLLSSSSDITPFHQQVSARSWSDVYNNFYLESDHVDSCLNADNIIILDDVLTSGSHFRAAQEFISFRLPQIKKENIKGVFWAKAEY